MNILVLNSGSSSIKYQLINMETSVPVVSGALERIKEGDYKKSFEKLVIALASHPVHAVGHRVVHGGSYFHDAREIDESVLSAIRKCITLAPMHNPSNLTGIETAKSFWPDVPHVAVFDTAFHARMPRRARTYAVDEEIAKSAGIQRFGFHGTSHYFVADLASKYLDRPLNELRIISCHLGSGASACAIEFGHSVDTSMGMTPLEGLVMGTRSGDIDPGIVLELIRKFGLEETENILNKKSGLAGLSGSGNDLRDIEKKASEGDDRARLSISVFAHRVRKYIGAYAAVMGGVDAVLMTGGIGENSTQMRQRILQRFEYLGLRLNEDLNMDAKVSHENPVFDISMQNSRVRALVIATNEELRIAQETERIIAGKKKVNKPGPIPIAVSARHAHLNRETMDILFGKDSKLTIFKPISQPGQFASNQKISIIGPRGRIDNVRVLGPLRDKPQIEISRTDEYVLGVDAPIRNSGRTEGSAPIIAEGPAGRISLKEGLICARRHIHMSASDAKLYGVNDKDEVEVVVDGGPRDLIFGDVLVRVKDSYILEMHIDTDEANAAELSIGASGDMVYESIKENVQAEIREKH